jgi:hypothetical protein
MKRKSTAYVQFKARMQERLRAKLEHAAKQHGVSINAEIIDRLERSFDREAFLQDLRGVVSGGLQAGDATVSGTVTVGAKK